MSEPEAALEDFPDYFVAALDDAADARVALVERGLQTHDSAGLGHLPRLGPVAFSWRYRIAEKQNALRLFFRRSEQEKVLFDHRLSWREAALPLPLDPSLRLPLRWEYRLHAPSFLVRPAEPATALAPASDGSDHAPPPMGFTLPDGRVLWATATVSFDTPKSGIQHGAKKPFPSPPKKKVSKTTWRIAASPDAGSPPDIAPSSNAPDWPLDLVVAWLSGLRAAQTEPETKTHRRALPAPRRENLPPDSFVNRFLASLVEAYDKADDAGRRPRAPGGQPALGFIQTVEDFAGEIDLRLTPDGQKLANHKDADGTPLRLSHRIVRLGDTARLEVRVRPPDLLVDSELRERLIEKFAENPSLKNTPLAERIRKQTDDAFLLRLGTDQRPLLLLVLPPDGQTGAALLSSRATIKPDPDGKTPDIKLSSAHPGPAAPHNPLGKRIGGKSRHRNRPAVSTDLIDLGDIGTPADDTLKPEARDIVLGLMRALHRWGGLLP